MPAGLVTEYDQYLFGKGTHYDLYNKLGAHPIKEGKEKGVYFAVWAPNAKAVSVVGDFNAWDDTAHPMKRLALYYHPEGREDYEGGSFRF